MKHNIIYNVLYILTCEARRNSSFLQRFGITITDLNRGQMFFNVILFNDQQEQILLARNYRFIIDNCSLKC